jgi:lysophospholipase L1-like esterase
MPPVNPLERTANGLVHLLVLLGLLHAVACGGSPIDPSPQTLALSCPTSVTVEASSPEGATVAFNQPVAQGGQAPFNIQCSPAAGTVFPIGDTQSLCTASDADLKQASCSLMVRVRVSQSLVRTRFLAFGDSITAGTVSTPTLELMLLDKPDSYPFKLEQMLRSQYPAQDIVVLNRGWGGERLDEGVHRLPIVLDADKPEVLLLLEGVNEVRNIPTSRNAGYLRTMIMTSQQRGVDVVIATLMPVSASRSNSAAANAAIVRLNTEIAKLAQEFGLGPPVDLFGLVQAEPQILGADGLHPTADGYTRIAETFRDAVVSRYDSRVQATMRESFGPMRPVSR